MKEDKIVHIILKPESYGNINSVTIEQGGDEKGNPTKGLPPRTFRKNAVEGIKESEWALMVEKGYEQFFHKFSDKEYADMMKEQEAIDRKRLGLNPEPQPRVEPPAVKVGKVAPIPTGDQNQQVKRSFDRDYTKDEAIDMEEEDQIIILKKRGYGSEDISKKEHERVKQIVKSNPTA